MNNFRTDPAYNLASKRALDLEIESAQITKDLDDSYLAYLRGDPGPLNGKLNRAEKVARRSQIRLEVKQLGAQINEIKDRLRATREVDLISELKQVLDEAGAGHFFKQAFDRVFNQEKIHELQA